jgi:phage-related tail fiber protein
MRRPDTKALALAVAVAATLVAVTPALGQQAEPAAAATSDRWNITIAPYLWAAAMDGNATVAGISRTSTSRSRTF